MNAKELILKKINADTNWVDMYTVSFMLGDSLEDVGKLMLDDDITDLVNNYNSSIFDKEQNVNKIDYIEKAIKEETDPTIKAKYKLLLDKAIAAEEVRILGKILKINQGLPTNTTDTYSYIKSIEKYIENKYNINNINAVKEALDALQSAFAVNNFAEIKVLKPAYYKLKAKMIQEWVKFDLVKFIIDPEYKQEQIEKYENYKTNFNILEVIAEVPHFKEMFNVLALNKQILNSLSTRNELEDAILNRVVHISSTGNPNISKVLNKEEIRDLKDRIDEHLINSWIISKQIAINIPAGTNNNPAPEVLRLDDPENIVKFRKWIENYAIPLLKEKLPDNKFVSLLTFGLKKINGKEIPFYKLPFNMVQVDNTQKTRSLYEEALYAFNNLKTIKIEGIDMNLVDMFYLYNLLVNQDKFSPNSITRIFEDLISSTDSDKLLVYDFNSWIDKQDVESLLKSFPISSEELGVIQIDDDNDPNDEEVKIVSEEKVVSRLVDKINTTQSNLESFAEEWSKKEGWSVDYFNKKVRPKIEKGEAWQIEYKVSDDQESPAKKANMIFSYNGAQRSDVKAKTTLEAIKLGERTATTRYESDGHIDTFWKQFKVGDRIKFTSGSDFVVVEVIKPLTKLVLPKTTTSNSSSGTQLSLDFAVDPDTDTSDFGFKKPIADADVEEARLEQQADSQDEKPSDSSTSSGLPTSYYDTNPSVQANLINLVKNTHMKGLHLVSDVDLINEDSSIRNAKGFIRNGEIYINADRATNDTVIHEFGHLYLADAKLNEPDVYYNLLSKVRQTKTWETLRDLPEYNNKQGSDFDEEVLATIISDFCRDYDYKNGETILYDENVHNKYENLIAITAIALVSPEFRNLLYRDILPKFDDVFISNYKESQRLATVKDELIKDNIIEENCK